LPTIAVERFPIVLVGDQIADSARLMASEPQRGARARIFQFCMDLGIERAFSPGLERNTPEVGLERRADTRPELFMIGP
jgi:hypothetical protein